MGDEGRGGEVKSKEPMEREVISVMDTHGL